jgi:cellulose synthase operon protein C
MIRALGGHAALSAALGAALVCAGGPAKAGSPWAPELVWPDVAERVQRDLAASDVAARRAAAHSIRSLGSTDGARLALTALADPDDEVRLAAADAAIRFRAAGATDIVVSWLNAPDARLRREACAVARALPDPRAVGSLARTLGDADGEVRAAAAAALGHQASAEAVAPLLGRLDDASPAVRIEVVASLARLGDPRAVVPLVGKVEDSAPDVRQAVVRALGDLGDGRASSALVLALRDQSMDVRRNALAALGRMHATDAVDAIATFVRDRAPAIRSAALAALGRIGTPEAVAALVASLGTGDDATGTLGPTPVRDALVAAGPDRAAAALQAVLSGSPSAQAATSAAWILGQWRARPSEPAVVAAMRRGVLPVPAALHALATAGGDADVPIVLEFITDPSPLVRAEALGASLSLLDPSRPDGRAVEPLADALRSVRPTAPERARIARLLGRTGAPRAAPLLVDLARTKEPSLRVAALEALGTLGPTGGAEAEDTLLDAMTSVDPAIRLPAAVALSECGSARARDVLLHRLTADEGFDRAALLTALGGTLARAPSDAAVERVVAELGVAAGPERDALIETIGLAHIAFGVRALADVARSAEPADRRAAAVMTAAHPGDAAALAVARGLLDDGDASVRAQAAWALGSLGDVSDVAPLERVARAADFDAATNAVASMGRILARHPPAGVDASAAGRAPEVLCPFVDQGRVYVRANALAALALSGARCADGAREGKALAEDPSEDVRAAAARAVASRADPRDEGALARCARADPSGAVSLRCRSPGPAPTRSQRVLVYVVPEGSEGPVPDASYALLLADGTLRAGTADRRGAVFDPAAPEGDVSLRSPSALAR